MHRKMKTNIQNPLKLTKKILNHSTSHSIAYSNWIVRWTRALWILKLIANIDWNQTAHKAQFFLQKNLNFKTLKLISHKKTLFDVKAIFNFICKKLNLIQKEKFAHLMLYIIKILYFFKFQYMPHLFKIFE